MFSWPAPRISVAASDLRSWWWIRWPVAPTAGPLIVHRLPAWAPVHSHSEVVRWVVGDARERGGRR